jgi:hypothetical protein
MLEILVLVAYLLYRELLVLEDLILTGESFLQYAVGDQDEFFDFLIALL